MITVPLKLALRDFNIETHDAATKDSHVYNSIYDMMNKLIDVVNEIDPSLSLYRYVFRSIDRDVILHSEKFFIQYDGADEYRLIWRDFVVGWYKHPRRCLQANRELSVAEQACLLSEFRTDMVLYFDKYKSSTELPKEGPGRVDCFDRMIATIDKIHRNGTVGSRASQPLNEAFGLYGNGPNENGEIDLSEIRPKGEPISEGAGKSASDIMNEMRKMAEDFKPVTVVPYHNPDLVLSVEAAMRDFKTPILSPPDIGGDAVELPNIIGMIHDVPRGDGAFLKSNALAFTLAKNRQLQASDPFALNLEMPMNDYPPFITIDSMSELTYDTGMPFGDLPLFMAEFSGEPGIIGEGVAGCHVVEIEEKNSGTAPPFYVRHGRVRPKKLVDMVKFALFALYHPLMN